MFKTSLAQPKDLKAISQIDKALNVETNLDILKEVQQAKKLYLASKDKKIIGYGWYNFIWGEFPYLQILRVLPEYQNQGVGKKILEAMIKKLSKYHKIIYSSTTNTNKNSLAFHQKLGFKKCGYLKFNQKEKEIFFYKNI